MMVFAEDSTLQSMNDIFAALIPNYSLLGDLPLTEQDFNHLALQVVRISNRGGYQRFNVLYKECLSVFLVFCAVYKYSHKTYWKSVEEYFGELSQFKRVELYNVFSKLLDEYGLHHFEDEADEGLTYVTPILCHAGIPINAYDNYFSAISNTVNDSFYDDFDVDDYLYYLRNKTEVTVKRYIKLANKKDSYNFIQNTRKLILTDSVDQDEEMENGNYTRMLEQISVWMEKPKVKKNLQARSNVQITAPKIKIDLDGVGIYCEIPRIVVKDCYDSYILWEIVSDETSHLVKADFFRKNDVLVSEEKIISLKPASTYTVTLKVDDQQISKWEFDGVRNHYLAFLPNGNLITTEWLPNTSVIFLLHKEKEIINKEELPIMELPSVPLWAHFNVYRIDLSDRKVLTCTDFNIPVSSENKPVLIGGKTIFNQENSKAYMELPSIKVPSIQEGEWHLEIKHRSENIIGKINASVPSNCEYISVSSYIRDGCYGNYDIKIWNRTGITGKFSIEYVPFGMVQIDLHDYWPSRYHGYVNNIQTIRTTSGVELEIYNASKVSEIQHGESIIHKYKASDKNRFFIGEYRYRYNSHIFSTSIKIGIHPVSWGIIGVKHETIELTSRVHSLTLEDFANDTDPYLLLAFGFQASDNIRTLTFELINAERQIIMDSTYQISDKDGLRIPLNPYLFEMKNANGDTDYHLSVSLFDSQERLMANFLVARIQDEVVIRNARITQNDEEILIKWDEMGTQVGRECVLVNFLKPWLAPKHFKMEDKTCRIFIEKKSLEEGIYRYIIQKQMDDLFFDESEAEVCVLPPKDFPKGRLVIEGEHHLSSDLERVLYQLLRSRFLKKELVSARLQKIDQDIERLQIKMPEDMNQLAYAYILHERFFADCDDVQIMRELFTKLFDLFSNYGKETIKYVLESDFSTLFKKKLLHHFHCNNLTASVKLNDFQMKLLAEIDEDMAGFINLVQAENNTKGLNWAGISDLSPLHEESLFGDGETGSTFLSEENLGISSYITSYFNYVANSLLRPKNLTKTTEDFIREFQRDHKVKETKIFGKTRLHLLADWKSQNRDEKTIQSKLAGVLEIPCDSKLKSEFADAFQALAKRKPDDELGYYIGLIVLYASFIRNGLLQESEEFSRLLHYTIENCGKLFYRDAIFIELYMKLERGFSWG